MFSGRKKLLEALQVQDHRALRKAEAWSPLRQAAWKPGCLPEAALALGILSHLTPLIRKSIGQELPNERSTLRVLSPGSERHKQPGHSFLACGHIVVCQRGLPSCLPAGASICAPLAVLHAGVLHSAWGGFAIKWDTVALSLERTTVSPVWSRS